MKLKLVVIVAKEILGFLLNVNAKFLSYRVAKICFIGELWVMMWHV